MRGRGAGDGEDGMDVGSTCEFDGEGSEGGGGAVDYEGEGWC